MDVDLIIMIGVVAILTIAGLFLLAVLFGILAERRVAAAARRLIDPIPGNLLVTSIPPTNRNAMYEMIDLTGLITADGIAAFAVQKSDTVPTSKWPRPGQTLPVIVDRADPSRFTVEWDKVRPGSEMARDEAERLAATMRAQDRGESPRS